MRKVFVLFISAQLIFTPSAGAINGSEVVEEESIKRVVGIYSKSKTLADFLFKAKVAMPSADYEFLRKKISSLPSHLAKLPELNQKGPKLLSLKVQDRWIPLEFLSVEKSEIRLNNKVLSIPSSMPMQERWDKMISAIQIQSSAGLMDLVLPRAEAEIVSITIAVTAATAAGAGVIALYLRDKACKKASALYIDCNGKALEKRKAFLNDGIITTSDKGELRRLRQPLLDFRYSAQWELTIGCKERDQVNECIRLLTEKLNAFPAFNGGQADPAKIRE